MAVQVHTWLEEIEKIMLGTSSTNTRFTATPFLQAPAPFDFREVPQTRVHRGFRVEVVRCESPGAGTSLVVKDRGIVEIWVTWEWQTDNASELVSYRDLWRELDRIERAVIGDRAANSVFNSVVFGRIGQEVKRMGVNLYVGCVSIWADFEKDLANVA